MTDKQNIRDFRPGQKLLSAANMNKIAKAARQRFIGTSGININQTGDNVRISLDHKYTDKGWWLGRITEGEAGATVFTDENYQVRRSLVTSSDTASDLTYTDRTSPYSDLQVVTNLTEAAAGTHLLSDSQQVVVFEIKDNSIPPVKRFVMSEVPPDATKITFPARLKQENSSDFGEYDQWEEVETDDAATNTWQTKAGGRTHTSTSESLWEANQETDIHAHATTGTIVWVHGEEGDEHRYVFDYQNTLLPTTPVSDGTYITTITVSDGGGTTTWETSSDYLLPSFSGESQYMVLQLDDTPAPVWGWVKAHG